MKKYLSKLIFIISCIILCVTLSVPAVAAINYSLNFSSNDITETKVKTKNTINKYIESVNSMNTQLSEVVLDDVVTTITFSKSMDAEELERYVDAYNIEIVQLQARGYDKDGNRITFFSRTDKGLEETFRLLNELANSDEVVLAGAIGMYALTSSSSVSDIQNDNNTLLIDSSADQYHNDNTAVSGYERNVTSSPDEEKTSFANSIAWDAEELGLVYYEVQY
ncbi:MAG: hypothetical protein IJ300_14895 [Clostridia bacterium]|nr:hypothetical protein [Clostridia bacterium]MBQ8767301.1 hypothetical protein [Clostridia bacterium]